MSKLQEAQNKRRGTLALESKPGGGRAKQIDNEEMLLGVVQHIKSHRKKERHQSL